MTPARMYRNAMPKNAGGPSGSPEEGLDHREGVAHPMMKFSHEKRLPVFGLSAGG